MNFTTGYILTKAGEALHAKVEAGTTLKLTKMQLGSGTVTTVDDYYERSALVEPQNAMSIAEIQQVTAEKNMCVATAMLTNAAVDTSYTASELGLFAQNTDGTEILYAVSYDDHPSYIASKNDGTDITMKFSMYIVATSEITITLTLPKTAEEIATIAAGYAAQAAESELKAKQLEATANNYLQTTQQAMTLANSYADLSKAWAESATSPDSATDTDSPTGYTQSAKIWAELSKEYAGLSKFKLPIGYYNSVAEMRASETAIVGRPCVTLGYYEPNDGGGGVYIIRQKKESDVDDGGSGLVLDNGNVAELLIEGAVTVKQFGAKGDGETDDTNAFVMMLKHDNCYIPSGKYVITSPIVGKKEQHIVDLGTYTNITPCYPQNHRMIPNWEHAKFRKWAKSRVIPTNYYLNGVCYNDKTKKWVISTCTSDSTKQKIMVLNNSNYSAEAVYDYTTLNHANTLAYCPDTNIIYIPLNDSNKKIARIDASTYAELPPITINERLFEMYYDRITKVFVGVYTPGSEAITRVYVYDANFTPLNTFDVDMGTYHELNGGCAHDGHLIFCTTSGDVYETDFFGNVLNKLETPRSGIEPEDADYCVDTGHIHYFAKCTNWETTYNAFAVIECSSDDVFMTNSVMLLKNQYLIGETFDTINGINTIGYVSDAGFISGTIQVDKPCPKGLVSIVDTSLKMSIISTTGVIYDGTIADFLTLYSADVNLYAEKNHITIELLSKTGGFTMTDKFFTINLSRGVSLLFVSDSTMNT